MLSAEDRIRAPISQTDALVDLPCSGADEDLLAA